MATHSVSTVHLKSFSLGNSRSFALHSFVPASNAQNALRKVYIQAALHADELAGTLVAARLIELLKQNNVVVHSHIVIVPVANPIGLSQELLGYPVGRFALAHGTNFNRGLPMVFDAVCAKVADLLTDDVESNVHLVRETAVDHLLAMNAESELDDLRRQLMLHSVDSDIVIDLHTDDEAELHMYTCKASLPLTLPLAAFLEAETVLLADCSASEHELPFDEAHSYFWDKLCRVYGSKIRPATASCTVELRGCRDVNDEFAEKDAVALFAYLVQLGCVSFAQVLFPPQMMPVPTELTATQLVKAPLCGILVQKVALGQQVQIGDCVAAIVDPMTGQRTDVFAGTSGRVFAMSSRRMARPGTVICKIRGIEVLPDRKGHLLTAR